MESLKFSVSMCVYGGDDPTHFNIAVGSIVNQTLKPDEIVLFVDGAVGDETNAVISKYENEFKNFKVIRSEKNVGHGNARRACLEACSNNIVALMDADDISEKDRFEKQISAFEKDDNLCIVGGQITEFIESLDNIAGKRIVPETDAEIKEYMKKRCPMNQVTVMFKKDCVLKAGGYLDWFCEEDYYLWIRMALSGQKFANLPDNLVNVRVDSEMYMRRGGKKYFLSEARLQKYMYKNGLIGLPRYAVNVTERLILQILMPNVLRARIYKRFARNND